MLRSTIASVLYVPGMGSEALRARRTISAHGGSSRDSVGAFEPPPERLSGLHGCAGGARPVGEPAIGRDHTDSSGLRIGGETADDLVVGGIRPWPRGVRDLDYGRGDKRTRRLLEDHRHLLPASGDPPLEQVHQADHRPVPVLPPLVGTRADHIHPVHQPSHLSQRTSSRTGRLSSCCTYTRRRVYRDGSPAVTASRIAAAVTVAAMVPIAIEVKRSAEPVPDERQKATSPSTSEWTGFTARATPALAILATRAQPALSSDASVITQTSDELRSSSRVQSGGASIAAISSAVERISPSSPLGPASARPSSPITSPIAFTAASAATVSPPPLRAAA